MFSTVGQFRSCPGGGGTRPDGGGTFGGAYVPDGADDGWPYAGGGGGAPGGGANDPSLCFSDAYMFAGILVCGSEVISDGCYLVENSRSSGWWVSRELNLSGDVMYPESNDASSMPSEVGIALQRALRWFGALAA